MPPVSVTSQARKLLDGAEDAGAAGELDPPGAGVLLDPPPLPVDVPPQAAATIATTAITPTALRRMPRRPNRLPKASFTCEPPLSPAKSHSKLPTGLVATDLVRLGYTVPRRHVRWLIGDHTPRDATLAGHDWVNNPPGRIARRIG